MREYLNSLLKRATRRTMPASDSQPLPAVDPIRHFHSDHYLRHNARRLEHLASLHIPVAGSTVLEIGAGVGDHTHYYLDRGCQVTITEARTDNLACLRKRYPGENIVCLNLESPTRLVNGPFDVVHCYGLLYHVSNPQATLEFLSSNTRRLLLLETCVSFGTTDEPHVVSEVATDPTQAVSGVGCRPTRSWIFNRLRRLFEFVYVPTSQPNHEEFPIDWTVGENPKSSLQRAVFVASRDVIENPLLVPELLDRQVRHA